MIFWIGLSILVLIFFYIGVPLMYARWLRLLLKVKVTKLRTLVLTFDDGPSSTLTPVILRVLADCNVKASFFLSGRNIAGREDIVKQIIASGHEICSHGYSHLHYWKVSPFCALSDIKKGWQAIDDSLGTQHNVYPFRPPYGKLNLICLLYLWLRKAPIIYWTLDCGDTWPHEKRNSKRMALLAKKAGGAVALAHDFDRSDNTVDDVVIELVCSALTSAQQEGLHVLTVTQLLGYER